MHVCPLLQFHSNPDVPLVAEYKDLLFEAIDHGKLDIAERLAFLGVDCSVRKPVCAQDSAIYPLAQMSKCRSFQYFDVLWPDTPVWMNALERAQHLNLEEISQNIIKYGKDLNYWGLGVKKYVEIASDTYTGVKLADSVRKAHS